MISIQRTTLMLVVFLLGCSDGTTSSGATSSAAAQANTAQANAETQSSPDRGSAKQAAMPSADDGLGAGFVVWESNRGGAWRLWRRDLGVDGKAHPLTPAEPSRAHCCAHIAPDGQSLVYLSLPVGQAAYPTEGAAGELRRLETAAPGERVAPQLGSVLAPRARTYFEHRAAVWKSNRELIWIDGEGKTVLTDLAQNSSRLLVPQGSKAHGWLVNPNLSFASRGAPTFSPYDAQSRDVDERAKLGGCQPYFSADGRLGIWVAGAGGPIRAMDLETRRQWPILAKGDERLPDTRRYLYFPMPSNDGYALAWAGSHDEHDHTRADYDVFVAATDPKTLELIGPPIQITRHPSTDRFPAVWLLPMELGRHVGEAPFTARLEVPAGTKSKGWTWDLGNGEQATGTAIDATWNEPGTYDVTARQTQGGSKGGSKGASKGRELRGRVRALPAAPPQWLSGELRDRGRELRLRFDEPVNIDDAEVSFEDGTDIQILAGELESNGTLWRLSLSTPIVRPTQVTVRRIRDRASRPNVLQEAELRVEPPHWPTARRDLVFLWQTAGHANRIPARGGVGEAHTTILNPKGRSFTDRLGRMVLRGGAFQADNDTMDRLFLGLKAGNELTLELTLVAQNASTEKPAALFAFAAGGRRNLILTQEGDRLTLRLRTPSTGQNAENPVVDVGQVRAGTAQHLVVTYSPGRLRAYLDGEVTADTEDLKSGFFHWQRTWLRLGAMGPPDGNGKNFPWPWHGALEGVAVYARPLEADEVETHFRRYREQREQREAVDTRQVTARLLRRSPTPSLQAIAPYQEALAVFEYEVLEGGDPSSTGPKRVVHRVLIDGRETPIAGLKKGGTVQLQIEPFDAQPQLESLFLSDEIGSDGKLYWSDRLDP